MSTLTEVGEEVQSVAKKAGLAVVGIGQRWGVGSGVVVASGQILTNAHNVRGDEVTVTWGDGRSETAKVEELTGRVTLPFSPWPRGMCRRSSGASKRPRSSSGSPCLDSLIPEAGDFVLPTGWSLAPKGAFAVLAGAPLPEASSTRHPCYLDPQVAR